jgi:hypothetical protein
LTFAPECVKQLVENIKVETTEFIETTEEAVDLANQYISEKVVGQTIRNSFTKRLHDIWRQRLKKRLTL